MIKEFAFGVTNRHHFQDANKMGEWQGLDSDTFTSLYDYDEYVIDFYAKNNTLSGFDGLIYMPDEFILDVDGKDIYNAQQKTIGLIILLNDLNVPHKLYFSGTGFHIGIPGSAFRWKPSEKLHLKVKDALTNAGIFEYADPSVTDKSRIIRVVNTKNTKSGLWKVEFPLNSLYEVDGELERTIGKWCSKPQKVNVHDLECEPVFDVQVRQKPKKQEEIYIPVDLGYDPDPVHYPCIQKMMKFVDRGERHMAALRIASHIRWRFNEDVVRMVMESWRQRVSTDNSPFKKEEMDSIIKSCYEGHGGQGNNYGCADPMKDKYCESTCKLYKSKKSQNTMNAESMENVLIDFYRADLEPLNLGEPYGKDFPVYPGETVILQAPPASMKTMLLQNWMTYFKRPTYFVEMEMSPRQIWSRFVQIEMGWDEHQLANHYKQMKNGMDKRFEWLTVDYSAPYPQELDKRISMLPVKPEIVVVDHLGLFRSKQRDNNMKVEEASQAIMELAVKHNVIVFAVSEVSKAAFKEGMDIASSRGSFRIAYNANKLISLKPYKNKETGLVEILDIKSDKNREKEHLYVRLNVNNVRIER